MHRNRDSRRRFMGLVLLLVPRRAPPVKAARVIEQPGGRPGVVVAAFGPEVFNLQRAGLLPGRVFPVRVELRRSASPSNGVVHFGHSTPHSGMDQSRKKRPCRVSGRTSEPGCCQALSALESEYYILRQSALGSLTRASSRAENTVMAAIVPGL